MTEPGVPMNPGGRAALIRELNERKNSMQQRSSASAQPRFSQQSKALPRLREISEEKLQRLIHPAEPSHQQKLLNAAAWLADMIGDATTAHALYNKGADVLPIVKAASEGVNATGGALVPDETAPFILAYRDRAVFRQNASVYPMASDSLTVTRRVGGVSTAFVGENQQLVESNAVFDAVSFMAKKLAGFGKFSTELAEDSATNVVNYFLQDVGSALGLREDDCGFNGDGTSTYAGMTGITVRIADGTHSAGPVTAASTHKTFALLDATDLQNLMAALPDRFWPNAKFYISAYGAASFFARLGAAGGGFQVSGVGPARTMSYGGVEIITTPKLPGSGDQSTKAMILFGDLSSAAALGSRRELTLMVSDQKYLEFDELAYRCTERFDCVTHNLGDGTNAGAIVALQGTA